MRSSRSGRRPVDWLIAIPLGKALQVLSSKTSELAYAM